MNNKRYQIIPITQGTTASAIFKEVSAVMDSNYSHCTGIAFVKHVGIGVNIKVEFLNNHVPIFQPTPELNWDLANGTVRDIKEDIFRPIRFLANGNTFRINWSCDSISTAYVADVILRLENLGTQETVFPEIGDYNFQHKRFTLPSGTATKYEFTQFNVLANYKKIKGIWVSYEDCRFAVKNPQGAYILDQIPGPLLVPTKNLAYSQRFMPWEYKANGSQIKCEIEPISTPGTATLVDVVLLVSNK